MPSPTAPRDLVEHLGERLSASELKTLELDWTRVRAARRAPAELRAQADRDRLFAPSSADPRALHAIDAEAFAALPPSFDAIELGPVVPLGAAHALAGTPQDNVLSATRGAEVSGDPTIAMALIAASRIRAGEREVRLAASTRAVRMQKLEAAHHVRHFRLFALATAGRRRSSEGFSCDAMREHLAFHLAFLTRLRAAGFSVGPLAVRLTDTAAVRALARERGVDLSTMSTRAAHEALAGAELPTDLEHPEALCRAWPACPTTIRVRFENVHTNVSEPLRAAFPEVAITYDLSRLRQATYYAPLCFHVDVGGFSFGVATLADGGEVGWTGALLADRRQRLFTSGIGTELVATQLPRDPGSAGGG